MKRIVLIAVLLLSSIFYVTTSSFEQVGFFNGDGYVFTDNTIQENLYSGNGIVSKPVEVFDGDTIYQRWGSNYIGESVKQKINVVYPMIINDGTAIKLMNSSNDVIDEYFDEHDGYEGLIINNGEAFNNSAEKADNYTYYLTRLVNNLYINNKKIGVRTITNNYSISLNSFIYFTPDAIYYYQYSYGNFKYSNIEDVSSESTIIINDKEFKYQDFLILLGEEQIDDGDTRTKDSILEENDIKQKQNAVSPVNKINGSSLDTKGSSGSGVVDSNGVSGSSAPAPTKNKNAKQAEAADVASGSTEAAGQIETSQEIIDDRPYNTEWVMPAVKVENFNSTLKTTTYTMSFDVEVIDPANAIINSSLTFDICYDDVNVANNGSTYKRYTTRTFNGVNTIRVTGLKASTGFTIKGYFQYKNKYGSIVKTPVVFLNPTHFETKDVGDLGKIVFDLGDIDNNVLFSNRIILTSFSYDDNSSLDAVSSIKTILMTLTNGTDTKVNKMSTLSLESFKNGSIISFSSSSNLKAGTEYNGVITCYDEFNNLLVVENNTFTLNTCKTLPVVNLNLEKPTLQSISFKFDFSNPDNVQYTDLYVELKDSNNNKVNIGDDVKLDVLAGNTYNIDNLGINKNYTINVVAICDLNDRKGMTEHILYSKNFITGDISNLGSLYIIGKNISESKDVGEINRANRAVLTFKLNSSLTNKELLSYVDMLNISFDDGKNITSYSLSDEELESLKSNELITIDTDKIFDYYLLSNTQYLLSYIAYSTSYGENIPISTSCTLSMLKTIRKPMTVEIKSLDSYQGFITSKFRVVDDDNISANSNLILKVYKVETDKTEKLVGSFNIPKGEYYDLAMFSDASYSSDGNAYNIEGNSIYMFKFITEEAHLDEGLKINYVFYKVENIKTEAGISANLYLSGLTEYDLSTTVNVLPSGYTQLEYLKSTGTQFIIIPYTHNKETWVDMKVSFNSIYSYNTVFGSASGDNTSDSMTFGVMSGPRYNHDLGKLVQANSPAFVANQPYRITWNFTTSIVDGTTYPLNGTPNTCPYNTEIFGRNLSNSYYSEIGQCAFYSLKIYEGEFNNTDTTKSTLKFDLVAAKNDTTGELGLYDLVSHTFFKNSGSGSFIAGDVVTNFDDNSVNNLFTNVTSYTSGEATYQNNDVSKYSEHDNLFTTNIVNGEDKYYQLDYLKSTGTQYILIPYYHNTSTWIDMDVSFNSIYSYNTVMGAASGDNTSDSMTFGVMSGPRYNNDLGRGIQNTSPAFVAGKMYNIKWNFTTSIVDGTTYPLNGVPNSCTQYKTEIFGRNLSNSYTNEIGKCAFSGVKIYEGEFNNPSNSTLKFDLVPVKKTTGELGLYDLVSNTFYPNNGTGVFEAGPLKSKNTIDEKLYTRIDYIQSNGTQFIDTNYLPNENTNVRLFGYKEDDNDRYYFGNDNFVYTDNSINNLGVFEGKDISLGSSFSTIKLFARSVNNSIVYSPNVTTLYWLQIYEGANLVRDFVPARRLLDGVIGLYDCVNKKFYTSTNGNSSFVGSLTQVNVSLDKNFAPTCTYPDRMYDASLVVDLEDTRQMTDIQHVYLDVYRYRNNTKTKLNTASPTSFAYYTTNDKDNTGVHIKFDLSVFVDDNVNNYYYLELYTVLANGIRLPLDTLSFTTEERIYVINNIDEFFAIGTSENKYVVVNDLSYTEGLYKGRDDTTYQGTKEGIHWRSSYFNARVDFQGFKLIMEGTGPLIYRTNKNSSISNIVFIDRVKNADVTYDIWGSGTLVYYNYGTISNIYVEYSEIEDIPYRYNSYYTLVPDGEDVAHYRYQKAGGIAGENYGIIDNFVINSLTDYTCSRQSGFVAIWNGPGATIRNGYVYSSTTEDNKVNINIYYNNSSNDYFSAVASYNYTGGTIENVYALANINLIGFSSNFNNTGIITGLNYGILRNCYSVGDTTYNTGSLNKYIGKATTYGPAVGYTTTSYTNSNIYYVSTEYKYTSTNSSSFNKVASVMSLRNAKWQSSILGNVSFNVDQLVASGCYPQVNYSSNVMPIQELIPLPTLTSYGLVDLTYSYAYDLGTNEEADAIFTPYFPNYVAGDDSTKPTNYLYDEEINGYSSDIQPVILLFSDRNSFRVDSITATDIKLHVIDSIADGKGMTTVYALAYNPKNAYSRYTVNSVTFVVSEDDDANKKETVLLDNGRYLYVDFYKDLHSAEKWIELLHNSTTSTLSQNYVLLGDISFAGYDMEDVFVTGTYTGEFNGNNKTISDIACATVDKTIANGITSELGLFKAINSSIYDLNIKNVYFEGGTNTGILAGKTTGGTFKNIRISESYCAGLNNVGGLVGNAGPATKIINCSVSDTKLIATGSAINSSTYDTSVGGIVGYISGLIDINNSYAQDIFIEDWVNMYMSSVGGIVGSNFGSYTNVNNCFASGTIIGSTDAMGGIIGLTKVITNINNSYSNVDLITYNGNAGGIVGRALSNTIYATNTLSFGSITYGNLMTSDDNRLDANSFVCMDNTRLTNGAYYSEDSILQSHSLTIGSNENVSVVDGPSSTYNSTFGSFKAESYVNYLDLQSYEYNDYYHYPKLKDNEGNVISDQKTELFVKNNIIYCDGASYSSGNNRITFKVVHSALIDPDDIEFYTDFTYVDKNNGLNSSLNTYKGISSYAKQQALSFSVSHTEPVDLGNGMLQTTYTCINVTPLRSYDIYLLTGIKYLESDGEDNKTEGFLRVNKVITGLYNRYTVINDASEWISLFGIKGSIAENIKITGDIDFTNQKNAQTPNPSDNISVISNAQNGANVIANRIVGRIIGTDTKASSYLDIQNGIKDGINTFPYKKISNISLNSNYVDGSSLNWIYDGATSLIRTCITELNEISFDNVNVKSDYLAGIINFGLGNVHDVTFTNCDIQGKNASYAATGIISYSSALHNNIYVNNTNVNSAYYDCGVLIGMARSNKRHVGISNVSIEDSKSSNSKGSCGGIVGSIYNSDQNFYDGSNVWTSSEAISFKVDNNSISNVVVSGGIEYAGGISGYSQYSVYFRNNTVYNSSISTGSNGGAGGISGYGAGTGCIFTKNCVTGTTIQAYNNAGGIVGVNGVLKNNVVDDCIIVAKNSNAGGLWGTSVNGWSDRVDQATVTITADEGDYCGYVNNTKIYASTNAGGFAGTNNGSTSVDALGYVDNCEIHGNSNVGGAFGNVTRYWIGVPYIHNTLITPIDTDIYGITKSSTQAYFGGLIGTGGRGAGFVDKCIIGGTNANYVGGLQGRIDYYESNYIQANSICRDSVVLGNNYVGGLYGTAITVANNSGATNMLVATGNYSNAYVKGNNMVAGIAGQVSAYKYSWTDEYKVVHTTMQNMPHIEFSYFTGTIEAAKTASAIFGEVIGNSTNLSINSLVSMPNLIKATNVEVLFKDGDLTSNSFYYNWNNLLSESANLKVSLWSDTEIDIEDKSITTMEQLLATEKYVNHVGTMDSVKADYAAGAKQNRKFIYMYKNGTSVNYDNGYRYEFDTISDYIQLDYLKSSGTQYIIIPYTHNVNTWIDMKVSFNSIYSYNTVMGAASGDNTSDSMTFGVMGGPRYNHDLGKLVQANSPAFVANQPYQITWNYTMSIVDGFEYPLNGTPNTCKYDTEIFGRNLSNSYLSEIGQCAFYSIKIYEGEFNNTDPTKSTLMFDLVPVITNDATGELGLYDLVHKNFYKNRGTGTFTYGSKVQKPTVSENQLAYITNYISSFSLSGYKTNDTANRFYYNASLARDGLMPFTISGTNKVWEGNSCTTIKNPASDNQYTITMNQGVPIPGSTNYLSNFNERKRLYNSYLSYKDGTINKVEFTVNNDKSPNEDVISDVFDVYASSANTINIDLSGGFESYTQLEYLKSTGTQFILIPYTHNKDTWIDMEVSFNSIYSYNTVIGAASGDNTSDSMTFGVMGGPRYNHDLGKCIQVNSPKFVADQPYRIIWNYTTSITDGTTYPFNGTPNTCPYNTEIFGRNLSNSYYSEIGQCAFYSLKIYEGEFNNTDPNKSTLKFDLVPARNDSTGELGLYDLVSYKFYKNSGTGNFLAGADVASNASRLKDLIKIHIETAGGDLILSDNDIDRSTFTLNCDFAEDIILTIKHKTGNDLSGNSIYNSTNYTIPVSNLAVKAASYGNFGYYIDPNDGSIYKVDNNSSTKISGLNGNSSFVNIFNTYSYMGPDPDPNKQGSLKLLTSYGVFALNSSGYVYNVQTGSNTALNSEAIVDAALPESLPLYKFNYINPYYTFGTYSYIYMGQNNYISTDNRFYLVNNTPKLLKSKNNATYNDYYYYSVGNSTYEAYLKNDGSIRSAGNVDLIGLLEDFNNKNIKHITSSFISDEDTRDLSCKTPILIITYYDGTIIGYNVTLLNSNNKIKKIFEVTKTVLSTQSLAPKTSAMSFFMSSLNSLFSFSNDSQDSTNRENADDLVNLMEDSKLSLNQLVDGINEVGGVDEAIVSDDDDNSLSLSFKFTSAMLNNAINNNNDYSDKEESEFSIKQNNVVGDLTIDITEGGTNTNGTNSLVPLMAGISDGTNEMIDIGDKLLTIDNADNKYVVSYDEEKEDFDIYSIEELLENPDDPVSENEKVVDMATLRSLYNALGQEDRNESRGITLYVLVAIAISTLIGIFVTISKFRKI